MLRVPEFSLFSEIRGGGLGLEGLHNNHTYALPPTNNHAEAPNLTFKAPKPMAKEKPKSKCELKMKKLIES